MDGSGDSSVSMDRPAVVMTGVRLFEFVFGPSGRPSGSD